MRLIDADRLLTDKMKSKYYHLPNGDIAIPIIDIKHAPTIDAVEVVKCKDCYHAEDDITHMFCVYFGHKVYGDDYCSNAVERREDGEA